MGQPIPAQHPSVVLRSHFKLVRALLAIAMAAILALAAAVVIVANDDDQLSSATQATPAVQPQTAPGVRYDGGPDEGTRGATIARPQAVPDVSPAPSSIAAGAEAGYESLRSPATRYDGGPEEGTRGGSTVQPQTAPAARYDGGPEEGSRGATQSQFKERAGGPTFIHEGR